MRTNVSLLAMVLTAAACSAEAPKPQAPAAKPADAPAAKPADAPAAKPADAPAAKPADAPAAKPADAPAALKLEKTTPSATYPLKTCVVSGEELADTRVAYKWGDTEVQFCCPDCVKDFEKEPDKYLEKIRAATAAK